MTLSELSLFHEANGFANQAEAQENPDWIEVNILSDANKGELSFLSNSQYRGQLRDTRASTAIVDLAEPAQEDLSVLGCPNPYGAVAAAIKLIHGAPILPDWGRIPGPFWRRSYVSMGENISMGSPVDVLNCSS